jgi:hypothetical protein
MLLKMSAGQGAFDRSPAMLDIARGPGDALFLDLHLP